MRARTVAVAVSCVALIGCGTTVPASRRVAGPAGSASALGTGLDSSGLGAPATTSPTGTTAPGGVAAPGAAPLGASAGTDSATAGAPAAAAGPTPTGPIEIGFVTTGVSNASAFGATLGNTVTDEQIDQALVNAYNAHGGIDGRKIVPVFSHTDTGSSSWTGDFAAACANFTQDHHVQAVLGYVFDHLDAFESCLTSKHIPHLSTAFNVPDAQALRAYPLLRELATPTIERRSIAKVDGGLAMGVLTPASKIGVVMDTCDGTERAWNTIVAPYIAAKGLHVAALFKIGCANGSGDASSEAAQVPSLILHFRSAGVDRIMFDAVSEAPALFVVATASDPQGYHPMYIMSSLGQTSITASQIPVDQAPNVVGVGWMPVSDVIPSQWPPVPSSVPRCLGLLKSQGIVPNSPADFGNAFNTCEALFLYEDALRADGGSTDGPAVAAAIDHLGTSFTSAININGKSVFAPGRQDAPSMGRTFGWTKACSCFTYRSTMIPMD